MRETCVYCGKKIQIGSKEHIIQNALGGLYESTDICCGDCNNIISKKIDKGFTATFNGIISNIPNMVKSHHKDSNPSCSGKALYKGVLYDVIIKDGKVVSCPQVSRQYRCKINANEFTIVGYDFSIDNKSFKNGLGKIAFNFALDKGVVFEDIQGGIEIIKKENEINEINFNYMIIPFVPMNSLDNYLETETEMELYHNMILFSQDDKLWCYIDLFNTFQYYVLLSDKWEKGKVHEEYMQSLQRLDREIPDLYLRKPKHILIYADFYKIQPTLDVKEFKHRVAEAVRLASNKISMSEKIEEKFSGYLTYCVEHYGKDRDSLIKPLTNVLLYFDENDKLKTEEFRTTTIIDYQKREVVSYPQLILNKMTLGTLEINAYTYRKFDRLNKFLISLQNIGFDK